MEIKKGIAVSPGVVIANAVVLDSGEYRIPYRNVPAEQVEAELEKLRKAFEDSITELNSLRDATAEQLGRDIASIFDFHYGVLTQGRLREQIAQLIRNQNYSAAFAVREALRGYQRRFLKMQDQLLRERYKDVRDIERRLLRNLIGQEHEDLSNLPEPSILVAHDLTPSQSANLVKAKIIGVAME